ncbi:RNA-guided endonuclease InsQ/TnpB family protein, partial [Streptomyces syringium]|uniref:RNA-guided endonuclease InsQ/TnpB family protein n=1 Tax=Streptomyces syringium TaxID=76729 RepID=UPI0033E25655
MGKSERRALYAEAKQRVKAENSAWCADLAVWDEHRRLVVHKGKPLLDPGPVAGEDASDLARRLYARRRFLVALQVSDPVEYAAEKKAELARMRPRVLALKEEVAARGAYRPGAYDIQAMRMTRRDLPGEEGGCPWWPEVARGAFLCGFDRADKAWKNWMTSAADTCKGVRMGMPRFKKKGKATDSFTLANPARSVIHLDSTRRLRLAGVGSFQSAKPLWRLLAKGKAEITSVTVKRGGHRWYASLVCTVQQYIPDRLTSRQRTAGLIAADLGSQPLAVLSAPLDPADPHSNTIAAAKPYHTAERQLLRAQRALSRTQRGSKNRRKAARKLGKLHHQIAQRRQSHLHTVSKSLVTHAAVIAIGHLDLPRLTASARGTLEMPGK